MAEKLTSRKFWLCVAAFLGSLGASIAGFATGNELVMCVGLVCTAFSSAIYAACEAYVDGQSCAANTKTTTISATTNSKEVVASVLPTGTGTVTTTTTTETKTDETK